MMRKQNVDIIISNWLKASEELNFKIFIPYNIQFGNKKLTSFAYLPQFGSKNGIIIDLTTSPNYETNKDIIEYAKANNVSISFINIDNNPTEYNLTYFTEMLEDWGKFG